jgi:predicted MPP superfamily phosphohydrolase
LPLPRLPGYSTEQFDSTAEEQHPGESNMRVAHITDFHLPAKPGQGLNNTLPDANLIEAVSVLKRQSPKPDLIVLGGDLLDNGQKGNYEAIAELFKDVEAPLYTVVGNHDDLKALRKSSLVGKDGDFRGYGAFDHGDLHLSSSTRRARANPSATSRNSSCCG